MTYCAGFLVREGLVMLADSRMNAGPDNLSTYRKLNLFITPGERVLAVAAAGNLSVSQTVINLLIEGFENPATGIIEHINDAPTMFRAAQMIGRAVRHVRATDSAALNWAGVDFDSSFLLAGQIKGEEMKLFLVSSGVNFIESSFDTPFLQLGEFKYGRSIIIRSINFESNIIDVVKLGLISMADVVDSNAEVGLPIDVAILFRDRLESLEQTRIDPSDPYFRDLHNRWSSALRLAHLAIPRPPYSRTY